MSRSHDYHLLPGSDEIRESKATAQERKKQALKNAIALGEKLVLHLQKNGVSVEAANSIPLHLKAIKDISMDDIELISVMATGLLNEKKPRMTNLTRENLYENLGESASCGGACGAVTGCLCTGPIICGLDITFPATMGCEAKVAAEFATSTAIGCATGIVTGLLCGLGLFALNKCENNRKPEDQVWRRLEELCGLIKKELLPFAIQPMPEAPRVARAALS